MSSDEEDYGPYSDSGNESPEDDDVDNDDFVMDIGLGTLTEVNLNLKGLNVNLIQQGRKQDPRVQEPVPTRGTKSTSSRYSPPSRSWNSW